ncbi:hypothetical protein N7537_005438 [Penicillium hordei]|uniref:Uncharacterized protein n=1 Tax=Penicillium hordei TaxID=40994 RepID=A0AAD6E6X5_9EURO|nr:uncharacterized protein N7537_005438 [Penicillium hordei]KAJ5602482.1 hypothetical protein N7537_005438 [Penicillium hordei]
MAAICADVLPEKTEQFDRTHYIRPLFCNLDVLRILIPDTLPDYGICSGRDPSATPTESPSGLRAFTMVPNGEILLTTPSSVAGRKC